ncbi:unnamed protein product [Paramecium octaurelia]|uniref:Uncharacterized protein n=1 Tax=Paramecium octaurelia TaxID=43137 RepID=A0A8S1WTP5_PAROT|nr:unnamed protein product [Paramecium octaurelia]
MHYWQKLPFVDKCLTYDIGTTHVPHHLLSEQTHYNAREANIYLKKVLGDLYHQDINKFWISFHQTASLVGVQHKARESGNLLKLDIYFIFLVQTYQYHILQLQKHLMMRIAQIYLEQIFQNYFYRYNFNQKYLIQLKITL